MKQRRKSFEVRSFPFALALILSYKMKGGLHWVLSLNFPIPVPRLYNLFNRHKAFAYIRSTLVLSGQPALELYLESYQLILRELCRSLIQSKGLTKELEMLVRDLWLLRASLILKALGTDPANADGAEEEQQGGNAEPELFSSQTDVESSDKDQEKKPKERATPTIVDSLALCYMALMLLRVPISLGDFFRYARLALKIVNSSR